MIKIQKLGNRIKPAIGTILYGSEYVNILGNAQSFFEDLPQDNVISLGYISQRPFVALGGEDRGYPEDFVPKIDQESLQSFKGAIQYTCPYMESDFFWTVPLAIITSTPEDYMNPKSVWYPMATDLEWTLDNNVVFDEEGELELHRIQKIMMGTGYTFGTIVSDGHGRAVDTYVHLSNGDFLLCKSWVWYNK